MEEAGTAKVETKGSMMVVVTTITIVSEMTVLVVEVTTVVVALVLVIDHPPKDLSLKHLENR